jgi:hypothetical protein
VYGLEQFVEINIAQKHPLEILLIKIAILSSLGVSQQEEDVLIKE